jgi:putative DNA primase/helicase
MGSSVSTSRDGLHPPQASDEALVALADLASPVAAFVRDRCRRDVGAVIPCKALFDAWKGWADENGHSHGTTQRFGRDLRAVIPGLRVAQPRQDGEQVRQYRGIALR